MSDELTYLVISNTDVYLWFSKMLLYIIQASALECYTKDSQISINDLDNSITLRLRVRNDLDISCQGAINDKNTVA